jgi:N-acetylneuraminic acid mutarotase
LITTRPGHAAVLLHDGRVLALGGPIETITPSNAAELYDPDTGGWAATGSMLAPRFEFTATLLPDGKVLVAGGAELLASAELYDPLSGTWTATGALATGRYGHSATLLRDGRVLVAGGIVAGDAADDQMPPAELYDPTSGTWTATGAMAADRYGHTATLLPDGNVLVVGGYQDGSLDGPFAELYDPLSGKWTAAGNMAIMRSSHTATLLPNGTVLVAGGYIRGTRELCGQPSDSPRVDCMNPLASAELYDPQTGAWSATQDMVVSRGGHTATLLANGTVLVAGGAGSAEESACQCHAPIGTAELYDPSTGTWSATASMVAVRSGHTATLLPDGRVLVASGNGMEIGIGGVMLASAELYDPGSGN